MRKIHTQNSSPRHDGAAARKLAAATRAIIEPVESRLMMSITPVTEQVAAINAKFETTPVSHGGDAADDPAVWVNPTDASLSTIIGTDKQGALTVYDLNGQVVQTITGTDFNNVDVRGNLVAASNMDNNSISLFSVDATTRKLTNVSARTIPMSVGGSIYGLAMYQSATSGKTFVFITNKSGSIEQFEVKQAAGGKYDAVSVRKFGVGSIAEGLVADDETGALYVAQEDVAIWKYGAEPTAGNVRTQVDKVGSGGHLVADAEGLALYKTANGQGYLIASSQGSNDYTVYDRQTGEYVTRFTVSNGAVDGVTGTDGIEVTSVSLGANFQGGAFIAQDNSNSGGNQNFKVVSWADIANAQGNPLVIDGAQAPQAPTPENPQTPPPVVVNPDAAVVTEIRLIDQNTGAVLQTLAEGSNIDVAQYSGKKLNIEAILSPTKGSVIFELDGQKIRTENYAAYTMLSSSANWNLTNGAHTLTLTTYNELYGAGTVGNVYTFNFSVSEGTTTPPPVQNPQGPVSTPSTPSGVAVTVNGADSITVKWNAVSGATGYKISRSTNGTTYTEVRTVSTTNYVDSNLADSTKYYYKVQAYNSAGTSNLSSAASGTTQAENDSTPIDDIIGQLTGQPTASNTGATGTLTNASSNFRPQSGQTYSNLIIKGLIDMRNVTNVKFVNCVFDAGGSMWSVRCDDGASSSSARIFQNCEFKNAGSESIYGGGFTCVGSYIHHSKGDAFKPKENVLIQGNYITMLGMSADAHADGVQIRGGKNIKMIGNFFDMANNVSGTSSNSPLFMQLDCSNITFEKNWVKGGNFAVHAFDDGADNTIKIINNIFYAGSTKYGFGNIGDSIIWSGNVTTSGATATAKMK